MSIKEKGENQFVKVKDNPPAALPTALSDERFQQLAGGAAPVAAAPRAQAGGDWRQPAGPTAPAPVPLVSAAGGWNPIKGGTRVQVTLTGLNKKGKWMGKLVGKHAQGRDISATLSGDPPADAAEGKVIDAVVTAGGDPRNLGIRWA